MIDLNAYLAGLFVSLNMVAMGAEVIKIERPRIDTSADGILPLPVLKE